MNRDAWRRYEQGGAWGYDVTEVGYKYNMPDVAAALGITQLRKLKRLQDKRAALADRYIAALEGVPGIKVVTSRATSPDRNSWCLFVISNDDQKTGISRDRLIEELYKANIGTSVHFIPTHLFSAYKREAIRPLPTTEQAWKRLISLPLYPAMSDQDVDDVVEALGRSLERAHAPSSLVS
jgi:dTDP-4-amino-4,6-dideoxygalactose transaminase